MRLEHSIHVDATPEQVWSWLLDLALHYLEWHPDHVSAIWHGEANLVGSVLEVVEYLGGHREHLHLEVTEVDPPVRMAYRIRGAHGLLLPGGTFEVSAEGSGARFTASITCRLGFLLARMLGGRIRALEQHMREEGENLKRLVERAAWRPPAASDAPPAPPP